MNDFSDDVISKLNNLPCGVVIVDDQQRIALANIRAQKLTGLTTEMLTGSRMCDTGLGSEIENHLISGKEWWDWATGSELYFRTTIRSSGGDATPVFIKGSKAQSRSGKTFLYLCILDFAHLEEWAVGPGEAFTSTHDQYYGLIGKSAPMHELHQLIKMASGTGVNVLIEGESGTGKELVASAIHQASSRKDKPFIRVNCAALAETLLESELFGHTRGAFTGAIKDRIGTFEAAHEGTILLDEIGEISHAVQVKLLRVLQERVVVRVGDTREIPVDVRIIAATNKKLRSMVEKGTFREDLFYRLNVFSLHLPALRERMTDIPLLCSHFIKKYRNETGREIHSVSAEVIRLFMNYCWPGNIRELQNSIEHAFVVCHSEEIEIKDLPRELRVTAVREGICAKKAALVSSKQLIDYTTTVSNLEITKSNGRLNISEKKLLEELHKHGGNKSATARALGISNVALWKKLKKFGIG